MSIKKTVRSILRAVTPKPLRSPLKTLYNKIFWRGLIFDEVSYCLFHWIPLFSIRWTEDGTRREYLILFFPVVSIRSKKNIVQ